MANIRPFRAVRPARIYAGKVAALPYDVYSRKEAAAAVVDQPFSFLNIDRPETMFAPSHNMYAADVYLAARARYEKQKKDGVYIADETPCYYIYELTMDGRSQTGIVAVTAVDDYLDGVCKKHENTVEAKELDRIRHVDAMSAQTGPIFLSYHAVPEIDELVSGWKGTYEPENAFKSSDGIVHKVWIINNPKIIEKLYGLFRAVDHTYIADGHHRAASAVKVALKRRREAEEAGHADSSAEYNYFLSALFPDNQLKILDYNRVVRDLNGYNEDEFVEALGCCYDVVLKARNISAADPDLDAEAEEALRPASKFYTGMYLNGKCYQLHLKKKYADSVSGDPVRSLDVSVLQDKVLSGLLGIADPRTDPRITFVGGIRGLGELVRDADRYTVAGRNSEELGDRGPAAAFSMYPTSMEELIRVADAGLLMPPKSTWFEPKLRSGLFIHEF